jgi:hypothetical protein
MSKKSSLIFNFKQQSEQVQRDMLLFQNGLNSGGDPLKNSTECYLYSIREINESDENKNELPKMEINLKKNNIVEESKDE